MRFQQEKKLYYVKDKILTLNTLGDALVTLLLRDAIAQRFTPGDARLVLDEKVIESIGHEVNQFAKCRVHDLQVRSVPIAFYAGVLRHFYLRIDNIIELHPGTEQRLSLRGWHDETDQGSDRLERRYLACDFCTNAFLDGNWQDAKAFNLVIRNCDQSLNGARQSFAVANIMALMASLFTFIACWPSCRLLALLMLVVLLLCLLMQYIASTFNHGFALCVVEPISQSGLNSVFCRHIF